jgi:hypothetical protein
VGVERRLAHETPTLSLPLSTGGGEGEALPNVSRTRRYAASILRANHGASVSGESYSAGFRNIHDRILPLDGPDQERRASTGAKSS